MDGSTLTNCAHCGTPRRIDTWCPSPACAERVARSQAEEARWNTTSVRPVVPVVARDLDLDELERFAAAGDRLPPADVVPLIAEVRRLRAITDDVTTDNLLAEAQDDITDLRLELDADRKAIGVLGAAVGKVNALHQPDGDGFCRSCRTVESPCPTAVALGVGQ